MLTFFVCSRDKCRFRASSHPELHVVRVLHSRQGRGRELGHEISRGHVLLYLVLRPQAELGRRSGKDAHYQFRHHLQPGHSVYV